MIGFVPDEISMVLELLSAILNLGNIQFTPIHMQDGCTVTDKEREYMPVSTYTQWYMVNPGLHIERGKG